MEQNEYKREQGEIIAHSEELSIGSSNDVDCVAMQEKVFNEFLADLQSDSNDVELAKKDLVVGHTSLGKNHSDAQRASIATRVPDANKEKTMNDMLSRCRRNHVEVEDLALDPLPKNGFTCRAMLFCILGHNRQIGMIRVLKQQLLKIGIAKDNIAVCHGFEMATLKIGDNACKKNQICHYSVLHRWIPKVAQWLQKRRAANRSSHVVWFLEVDCELAQLTGSTDTNRKLLRAADLRIMASKQDIT